MSYIILKFRFRYIVYNTKYCYLLKKNYWYSSYGTKKGRYISKFIYKANITFILNFKKVRKIKGRPIFNTDEHKTHYDIYKQNSTIQ